MNPARDTPAKGRSRAAAFLAVAALATLAFAACSSITAAHLHKITPGMTPDQVTALLGQPQRIDHSEITGLTGDVYYYPAAGGEAKVVFVNDAVFTTGLIPTAPKSL